MGARLKRVTVTGLVMAGPCKLLSVHLAAVVGSGDQWTSGDRQGVPFSAGIYATLTGTGAVASFEIEP